MPDTRLLAPILTPELTDDQIAGVAEVLREWAGVEWLEATVDDLREARFHQRLFLDALERDRSACHTAAGVVDLTAYRKGRL